MSPAARYIYAITFIITAVGFLLPFWPLMALGILIAALSGRYLFAVFMALLVDIASGMPTGVLRYVFVPFTILALAAALVRILGERYFLDKTPPDTL